ncbi:DsbD family 2 [Leptospira borgpetersenii serovar Pomona str. 200901868]|nr:DsbD family 2 [Leptospira borgpetersenii serovar Pomona str. 200901868]
MQTELFLTTISVAFLHGITSSLHCLGMCGPFAGTLNLYQKEARFKTNLFYNLGRFLSYSTLGAILGFVGSGLNLAGNMVSLREFAAVISGIFVITFGLRLLQNAGPERSGIYQKVLNKFATPLLISLKQGKNLSGVPLAFGMVTGLLPCSALYPAFSLAFATGNIGYGSIIMSAFF